MEQTDRKWVFLMPKLEDYIQVVPGVLTKKACADILKLIKASDKWAPAGTRRNINGDPDTRNCSTLMLSDLKTTDAALAQVDSMLFPAASAALRKYIELCAPEYNITIDTGYEALRYEKGGFYKTHVDAFNIRPRVLSCSFALNDNYEGGEWAFFGEELKLKTPIGSAVLFPSNFCFPHQILPITKGTRYSVVTWFQ